MTADLYTAQLTKDTISFVTNQYFDLEQPFAFPRYGNECVPYYTGQEYFEAVAGAINGAKSFILITDWQLDYDVQLNQRDVKGHPGRLSELLAAAVQRGVHIRIILYDAINAAVDTHEEKAQKFLAKLPKGKGSIEVMLQNPDTGRSPTISKRELNLFFSHHQKSVVIDGQLAFLGGMDLAYGRWDTSSFDVVIDPAKQVINDAYNQQLSPSRALTEKETLLTKEKDSRPGFHVPYDKNGKIFDELFQPRQPWQDIALGIKGPAAFDVFVNFVLRWNSFAGKDTNVFNKGMAVDWFDKAKGATFLVDPLKNGSGTITVQICRSVSSKQLEAELTLWNDRHKYINDDWKKTDNKRRKTVQDARAAWVNQHQTSILDAMINCIRSAKGFIYIENQFFMSDCGPDQFGTPAPSNNKIIFELANKIGQAINAERPFHVWLVLPEHPEGKLEDAATSSQLWWALQGVKRAKNSLINLINASLLSKNAIRWKAKGKTENNDEVRAYLKLHAMQDEWRKYLTVLNLRNYGSNAGNMLTEMIYVHSKLLIVDDAVAIIGSANINDRSLNGDGDTELAAVVVDNAEAQMTDVGQGMKITTRKFARDLRMNQWKKHLGMLIEQPTTGVQAEKVQPNGINIAQPLTATTIKAIQQLAKQNRDAYSEVFLHTPRDSFKTLTEGREQAFPLLPGEEKKHNFASKPSLQPAYMKTEIMKFPYITPIAPLNLTGAGSLSQFPPKDFSLEFTLKDSVHDVEKATTTLRSKVKGFWCEMPLDCGTKEKRTPPPPLDAPEIIATNYDQEVVLQQGGST